MGRLEVSSLTGVECISHTLILNRILLYVHVLFLYYNGNAYDITK